MDLTIYHKADLTKPIYHSSGDDIIIGRPKNMPVHIDLSPDQKVSRPHAHLYYRLSAWWVEDLGSKHKTFVNGQEITEPTPLSPGDELQLGDTVLKVEFLTTETLLPPGLIEGQTMVDEVEPCASISEDKRTEILAHIAAIVASYSPGQALLERFLAVIKEAFPEAERGSIVIIDQDNELIPRASWPAGPAQVSFTLARQAIQSGAALHWVRDVTVGANQAASLFDTSAALCAPMLFNGHTIGVIYVDTSKLEGNFNETDRDLLSEIANVIAVPISAADRDALPGFSSVFISYAPADRELVDRLAADLRRRRVKVWYDERLQVGDDRRQILGLAIRSTDAFMPIVTAASLDSAQVQWELDIALKENKKILPLRPENCRLPAAIQTIVPLDIDPSRYQASLAALISVINRLSDQASKPAQKLVEGQSGIAHHEVPPLSALAQVQRVAGRDGAKKLSANRILILAANPINTDQLRLDKEGDIIREELRMGRLRDRFELDRRGAVQYKYLSRHLLEYTPNIVHFSGHGNKAGRIVLEDELEMGKSVPDEAIQRLFRLFKHDIRCVVLNACLTESQAKAIVQEIDCVVGMSAKIGDQAAIRFAAGFYRALGYGKSVELAFEFGCAEIGIANLADDTMPRLLAKDGVNPADIIFD